MNFIFKKKRGLNQPPPPLSELRLKNYLFSALGKSVEFYWGGGGQIEPLCGQIGSNTNT